MSNTNELVVRLTDDFGAMSRLMNMLRRRGFCIDRLVAQRVENGYQVDVSFERHDGGERAVELLVKQVGNLIDVRSVERVEVNATEVGERVEYERAGVE